jgi:hypothetical protein
MSVEQHMRVFRNLYFHIEQYYVWLKNRKMVIPQIQGWPDEKIMHVDVDTRINELRVELNAYDNPDLLQHLNQRVLARLYHTPVLAHQPNIVVEYFENLTLWSPSLDIGQNCFSGGTGSYEIGRAPYPLDEVFARFKASTSDKTIERVDHTYNPTSKLPGLSKYAPPPLDLSEYGGIPAQLHIADVPLIHVDTGHHSILDLRPYFTIAWPFGNRDDPELAQFANQVNAWATEILRPPVGDAPSLRHYSLKGQQGCVRGGFDYDPDAVKPELTFWCTTDVDYVADVYRDVASYAQAQHQGAQFMQFFSRHHILPIDPEDGDNTSPPLSHFKELTRLYPGRTHKQYKAERPQFWREQRRMNDCFLMFLDFGTKPLAPGVPYTAGHLFDLAAVGIENPEQRLIEILLMMDTPGRPGGSNVLPVKPSSMHLTRNVADNEAVARRQRDDRGPGGPLITPCYVCGKATDSRTFYIVGSNGAGGVWIPVCSDNVSCELRGHPHLRIKRPETRILVEMTRLWRDHTEYTSKAIRALTSEHVAPVTLNALVARLLGNQQNIGVALRPYIGDDVADALIQLLNEHITIAKDLVTLHARRRQPLDNVKSTDLKQQWMANATSIAELLGQLESPLSVPGRSGGAGAPIWCTRDLDAHMQDHLKYVFFETAAILTGNEEEAIRIYDAGVAHMEVLAEVIAAGLFVHFYPTVKKEGEKLDKQRAIFMQAEKETRLSRTLLEPSKVKK